MTSTTSPVDSANADAEQTAGTPSPELDWNQAENVVAQWISAASTALRDRNGAAFGALFSHDGWWRDRMVTSWDLRALGGPTEIEAFLDSSDEAMAITSLRLSADQEISRVDGPAGRTWIQAFFDLETSIARGRGIVRLTPTDDGWKAWTLMTTVTELIGHEEANGHRRPRGVDHGVNRSQANWADQRAEVARFEDADPQVVILGAGQGGLTLAARLGQLGVSTLILERNQRVGDSWRRRYRSLTLHDPVWANHLPYLPFPSTWPVFTPRDKMADWLETYSHTLELNVWTSTELESVERDPDGRWSVSVQRSGVKRTLHPAHFVIATGTSSLPWSPTIPNEAEFAGEVLHSSSFTDPAEYAGRRVLVVGASNSAHDIAHDLVENGAEVTIVQRSKTYVMSSEHGLAVQLAGVYEEGGPSTEDADLLGASWPLPILFQLQLDGATPEINRRDADMLAGLERAGFKTNQDGVSVQELFHRRGGGYYLNVGASEAIIAGRIKVRNGVELDRFTSDGVVYTDGTAQQADVVIFATGYQNMREVARLLLGDEVAEACPPVWGVDDGGELSGVWRRTGVDGLWFMGGNLNLIRPNSLLLALQIKAIEEGLAPASSTAL
jgi:cation diffusion facilitator CzcD-associated flavoprotein CzcO